MAFSLCVFWTVCCFSFAAFNHLPEVPDHHADPDPGSAAVCCASVPYSWGITHTQGIKLWILPWRTAEPNEEQHWKHELVWYCGSTSPQRDLLGIQHLLNSSEASLHQLTALLDCRGLNKVCSLHPIWHHRSTSRSTVEQVAAQDCSIRLKVELWGQQGNAKQNTFYI